MKSQSEWVFPLLFFFSFSFFHHHDAARFSSASSFFFSSPLTLMFAQRWTTEEKMKRKSRSKLHYIIRATFEFEWDFLQFFMLNCFFFSFFCYSTHRIYIMMEILNLLIYFISFFFLQYEISFFFIDLRALGELCAPLSYYSTIYRFFQLPFSIFHPPLEKSFITNPQSI